MTDEEDKGRFAATTSASSYLLRPLVQDVPLSGEAQLGEAHVTCVELCADNLYIGTSKAEILHYVSIPAEPSDESQSPSYIFASRLQPVHSAQASSAALKPGIQQILVLPMVQKACILCNGTLSFYVLPELSPAFNNVTVQNCTWVGGVDLNNGNVSAHYGVVVMICVKNKVRLVRIADEVQRLKDIQYPSCLISSRRGDYACVADSQGYALLDVENQQKISLFPISSLDENSATGKVEDVSGGNNSTPVRASSSARPMSGEGEEKKGHGRNTSIGALVGGIGRRQLSPSPAGHDRSGRSSPDPFLEEAPNQDSSQIQRESNAGLTAPSLSTSGKQLPVPPRTDSLRPPKPREQLLKPHICSPTSNEFLLTTGTLSTDSGVGLFVNTDGDVVRGTMEFSCYPTAVVVDGQVSEFEASNEHLEDNAPFVLATMIRSLEGESQKGVEIQSWDTDDSGAKEWMKLPQGPSEGDTNGSRRVPAPLGFGMRSVDTPIKISHGEIGAILMMKRLKLSPIHGSYEVGDGDSDAARNKEEVAFGRRLGENSTRLALWSGSTIWSLSRTPFVMKLDLALEQASPILSRESGDGSANRGAIVHVLNLIRGREPSTETEFLSLGYLRQKAGIILFADSLKLPNRIADLPSADLRIMEGLLMEGGIDPRVILFMLSPLAEEAVEGLEGVWVYAGLVHIIELYKQLISNTVSSIADAELLQLLKRYLYTWRQRKGFGSIPSETEVFKTVDAALLRILLMLDSKVRPRPSRSSAERQDLYSFVDSGLDCFDRAAEILENDSRLFTLSRLYQSRRLARKVLETWRRIIEGEEDRDQGLVDGEDEVRKYLTNVRDHAIVDEFGTWLARRNPTVGVQIFTNEASKVRWEPHQVVMLLRRRAPDAVKDYLEHLVFGKKNFQYANDLIGYYLDSVLDMLKTSYHARESLAQTYGLYRALRPPKPTYREYITENALAESWWHDRLRLLELIGGSHGSEFSYDIQQVLARIEPYEQDLVPESIILDGQQGRHEQALRLLTHGLGDYHTAVNYCLLGGASMFHPTHGYVSTPPSQDEQSVLFNFLLKEFLHIEDVSDRLERTSELIARFSAWFDIQQVVDAIPGTWSVALASEFLIKAFRRLVQEKNEAMITKALSGAQNLQIAHDFVEKCTQLGPHIQKPEVS